MAQFGIYIHWPFCESKCPYCDFNSHVSGTVDQSAWRDAYLAELDRYAIETQDRVVTSVFFGGGTPSLMAADTVAAVLQRIHSLWSVSDDFGGYCRLTRHRQIARSSRLFGQRGSIGCLLACSR